MTSSAVYFITYHKQPFLSLLRAIVINDAKIITENIVSTHKTVTLSGRGLCPACACIISVFLFSSIKNKVNACGLHSRAGAPDVPLWGACAGIFVSSSSSSLRFSNTVSSNLAPIQRRWRQQGSPCPRGLRWCRSHCAHTGSSSG